MGAVIVFGGWAVPPDVLKKNYGDDARYIDVNKIMPELFDGARELKSHWIDIVSKSISKTPDVIAGWSTGAMFAYALARIHTPKKLILISATPRFCRKDDFRFGARPAAVDQMIAALGQDKDAVLRQFYERCGLAYDDMNIPNYTTGELIFGLEFLKQADLRPVTPVSSETFFYHGRGDEIIPPAASAYFCERIGGIHKTFDGGHAFFKDFLTLAN